MVRERYRDSAGTLADYVWELGHNAEDGQPHTLNLQRTAVTTGVGFVRQQGTPSAPVKSFSGRILTINQYDQMLAYYEACATRTIFFRDVDNVENEVIITSFNPVRKPVAKNPREPTILWVWDYQLEMEVIS